MDGQPVTGAKNVANPTQAEFTAMEAAFVNNENAFVAAAVSANTAAQAHTSLSALQKQNIARVHSAALSSIAALHGMYEMLAPGIGYTIQSGGGPKNP